MLYLGVLYMLYIFGSGTSGIGMTMTMRREGMQDQSEKNINHTVDGSNPAPPGMYKPL